MFKQIFKAFVIWKIIIFFFAFLASFFLVQSRIRPWFGLEYARSSPYFLWIWANFDGVNYLDIARDGYADPNFAFFPLFPLLISLMRHLTTLPLLESGLLINHLVFFVSLVIFYKIALLDYDQKIAWRSLLLLLLFPVSFFFAAIYTEATYFLLATLAFYFARKEKWLWAGLFGFLAGLSRLVGISLLIAFLLEWMMQNWSNLSDWRFLLRKFLRDKTFFVFLIPLGIFVYGLFLQFKFGDFFLFQKAMEHWQQANFVFPGIVFFRYAKILSTLKFEFVYFVALLELVSFIFYSFLAIYTLLKIRVSYGVWMMISLLIPTFTGTLQSMPRYILHLFPAFIALSLMANSKLKFRIMAIVFLLLQFLLVALFTRGYFIA